MYMSDILNCCIRRGCKETHLPESDLCQSHYEIAKNRSLETEIKRLRIKIATLDRHNKMVLAGLNPAPLRGVWVVEGSNWIYT